MNTACYLILSIFQPILYYGCTVFTGSIPNAYFVYGRYFDWLAMTCAMYYTPKNRHLYPLIFPVSFTVLYINHFITLSFSQDASPFSPRAPYLLPFAATALIAVIRIIVHSVRAAIGEETDPFDTVGKRKKFDWSFRFYCAVSAASVLLYDVLRLILKGDNGIGFLFYAFFTLLYSLFPIILNWLYMKQESPRFYLCLLIQCALSFGNNIMLEKWLPTQNAMELHWYQSMLLFYSTAAVITVKLLSKPIQIVWDKIKKAKTSSE